MFSDLWGRTLNRWRGIEEFFLAPVRFMVSLVFYLSFLFVALEHFQPQIFESFTKNLDRTDTLLSVVIFVLAGNLKYLFYHNESITKNLKNLEHVVSNGSLTQFNQEIDAVSVFPKIALELDPKKIDIIQISGQNIVDFISRIAQEKPKVKFRLLLLDPELANKRFSNQNYDTHVSRVMATVNQIKTRSFNDRVEIKFYRSEPSICAIIVDECLGLVSWYRSYFENGLLVVHGHNSAAVIDNMSESGIIRKFAKTHFTKIWNCETSYGYHDFAKKLKFSWTLNED